MTYQIMVVDDDPAILDVMRMILEDDGYEVVTASSKAEVLGWAGTRPDLILLDIWLSGDSGQAICRQLKDDPTMQEIPVILVSANHDAEGIARESGADGFIRKPFDLDEVLDTVRRQLDRTGDKVPASNLSTIPTIPS